jgi:dTDP-4-dehydrorhamnose 3,5-epimerase
MKYRSLEIEGLCLIEPAVFVDDRGLFFESYSKTLYQKNGIEVDFVQDNIAVSKEGVIRALHYQSKPGQAKLVSCLEGKIWDVAVDIRPGSPTFGKWVGVELDDQKHQQLFIPVGFAHGYCVLSKSAKVQYKVSSP